MVNSATLEVSFNPLTFSPTYQTAPLSENFTTEGEWLIPFLEACWKSDETANFTFDYWQKELIRRALETYPPDHPKAGELRFRQVVIMVARQNGKTVLGAAFGIYGLIRQQGAKLIGLASRADQARILYLRTLYVIENNKALKKRFNRLTETRGIRGIDGSTYEIKASSSAAIQGIPISMGLVDEIHIVKGEVWDGVVSGMGGRKNAIIVGITTAGDDDSTLLKRLIGKGKEELEDPDTRFGYFEWSAPKAEVPKNADLFKQYLMAANPGVACGRIDLETLYDDVKDKPDPDIIRYHFNRFVSSETTFIPVGEYLQLKRKNETSKPLKEWIALDVTPGWGNAAIVAAYKDEKTGLINTNLVASIVKPDLNRLLNICLALKKDVKPEGFCFDGYMLKDLGKELKRRGIRHETFTQTDVINASSTYYAKIKTRQLTHDGSQLVARQLPNVIRKNIGNHFRISRKDSLADIDGVMAEALAVYAADTIKPLPIQVWVK